MQDATELAIATTKADTYCDRLVATLDELHTQVATAETRKRRIKALRQARTPGMRFSAGDLVMVSAIQNAANIKRHSKLMVLWQGPYQITKVEGNTTLYVQNIGGGKIVPVSWRKTKRLAGPELQLTDAVAKTALHDLQKFLVEEFLDWEASRNGDAKLHVKWRGYVETTWEPLANLHADVPYLVSKYVTGIDNV